MQSGIDSSRLRIAAEIVAPKITEVAAVNDSSASTASMQTAATNARAALTPRAAVASSTQTASNGKSFFGPQGPSFRDALDAINPLNQIPVVSDILASVTGHEPSTASKLAGGALATLISGPIGFAGALASVIFEDGAGKSPGNAVYAALTGEQAGDAVETQVASVDTAVEPVQLAELEPAAAAATLPNDGAYASVQRDVAKVMQGSASSSAVLDLYGSSDASAHASYKKAQLLPYLRDVNHTKVL